MQQKHPSAKNIAHAMEIARQAGEDFANRKFADARDKFLVAHRADPTSADYLNNLAACHLELGQLNRAVASATNALEINPGLSFALVNRADAWRKSGRMDRAAEDYSSALKLDPGNPVVLNKAGACLHMMGNVRDAGRYLVQALKLAPGFSLARMNLGLVACSESKPDLAREMIGKAISDPNLDPVSSRIGEQAIQVLDEHQRLQPFIDRALRNRSATELTQAVATCPQGLSGADNRTTKLLDQLAAKCADLQLDESSFRYEDEPPFLLFLEACSNCNLPESVQSMRDILARPGAGPASGKAMSSRNLLYFHSLCTERKESPLTPQLEFHPEALLRFWHARIMANDPASQPGQFKVVPNTVGASCPEPATPVECVRQAFMEVAGNLYSSIPAGPGRAIFLQLAVSKIHGFKDGNGRLARFLFNWELESAGYSPLVIPSSRKVELVNAAFRAYQELTIEPLVELLLEFHHDAAVLARQLEGTAADPRFGP